MGAGSRGELLMLSVLGTNIVLGKGIKLFSNLIEELPLKFLRKIAVNKTDGIFQFQYKVIR